MSSTVINVAGLSKQYRLGQVGTGSLSHDLNRWWYKVRGKEDPYLRIGDENDRTLRGKSEYIWALKDISFDVAHGEVLGIIGRNGAGKSTLLKILSKTTKPTTGHIKIRGRIASLLEVGTGFHPELSGRENIFLNGAILGMTRHEIRVKFDEIVDFAGVQKYVDTPVKRYSSGMYVRLAFAVAAHLEPEILIVDEVLAVGDADFQKKALGKMKDVSYRDGRTVLFVSHNMAAVRSLCTKGLFLENGRVTMHDNIYTVAEHYHLSQNRNRNYSFDLDAIPRYGQAGSALKMKRIIFNDNIPVFFGNDLKIDFIVEATRKFEDLSFGIGLNSIENNRLLTIDSDSRIDQTAVISLLPGTHTLSLTVPDFFLAPGIYSFDAGVREGRGTLNILDMVSQQFGVEILADAQTPNHFSDGQTGGYRPVPYISFS